MDLESVIAPLRARGARLAVDDMGAGYSGLRQITSVRPGYLKLDRSLISGIDGDDERAALVGALAGYSSKVGSLLVAEGVETEEELAVVRALGVPLVQGFYFSRPAAPWPELQRRPPTHPTAARASDAGARQPRRRGARATAPARSPQPRRRGASPRPRPRDAAGASPARLPALRAGRALERAGDLAGDPAAVEVARLRG